MAYTNLEGREGLLEALAESAELVGAALEYLGAAHERLDDLDRAVGGGAVRVRPARLRGCAPRLFRFRLAPRPLDAQLRPAVGAARLAEGAELIEKAADETEGADEMLAGLQDDQALVEVGDVEKPRAGVAADAAR